MHQHPESIAAAQKAWYPSVSATWHDYKYLPVPLNGVFWVTPGNRISYETYQPPRSKTEAHFETLVMPCNDADFQPILSPETLLRLGIFGNAYFGSCQPDTSYLVGLERWHLLPIKEMGLEDYQKFDKPNWALSYFGKKASASREWWMERNMISTLDPLGWFEWYCWYWLGRRHPEEDHRQIKRWKNFRTRQTAMLESNRAVGLQQALLHWSCDPWVIY